MERATKTTQEYQRDRYHRLRNAWLAGKVCAHCGANEDIEADHVDPNSKHPLLRGPSPRSIWHLPKWLQELELAKCQPLMP
jgi:hypothetical protein